MQKFLGLLQFEYKKEYDKNHDRNANETEDSLHQRRTSHPCWRSGLVCSLEKTKGETLSYTATCKHCCLYDRK